MMPAIKKDYCVFSLREGHIAIEYRKNHLALETQFRDPSYSDQSNVRLKWDTTLSAPFMPLQSLSSRHKSQAHQPLPSQFPS